MPVPFCLGVAAISNDLAPGRVLLVDGHAYAYRAFFAIKSLSSPSGEPTNAIFGFAKALLRLSETLNPALEIVIWDGGLAPERLSLLPSYKSERPPMPAALESQLDGMVAWLEASGRLSCCREGVEADDWIAAWARALELRGLETVIASSDKDFMQVVSSKIALVNPNDPALRLWTADDVRAKTGVGPDKIVDWLSLVGDGVDNIPGVPGVGPKTAASLLNQFGNWEALKRDLSRVAPERIRAALESSLEVVERNRELIRLRAPAGLPPLPARIEPLPVAAGRLRELYSRWGFRSLAAGLPEGGAAQGELRL